MQCKHILNVGYVSFQVMVGHQSMNDSVITDFCDGSHFQSHPLFGIPTPSFQVFLYYDDVELCNPLGSKRTKHKIGMFLYHFGDKFTYMICSCTCRCFLFRSWKFTS